VNIWTVANPNAWAAWTALSHPPAIDMWDPKITGMAWESFPEEDQTDFADFSSFPNGDLRGMPMEN
jgi:hypothetical protein